MRALVYADIHATDGCERCFADPTKLLQMHRLELFFDQIDRIYKEYKCDALWDLGDTLDDRSSVPVPVIDLLCERLEKYTGKWNLKLVGNHEQYLRDSSIHAGKMFKRFFHVIDSCEVISCGKVNIKAISYHDDDKDILDFLMPRRSLPNTLILGHFVVFGCRMPSGGQAANGMPHKNFDFADMCLLGHIHKPQSIGNIHYIGSPFQQDWSESGDSKRVALLDIEDTGRMKLTWVPIEGFPVYKHVTFDEFVKAVQPDSEDRYKVVLKSVPETEAFYAHSLANRADEPVYDYEQPATASGTESSEPIPHTKQDILRRYLRQNPPDGLSAPVDEESMLAYGEQISSQ